MALLRYLGFLLFVFSAVKSDGNHVEKWEPRDIVHEMLQRKLIDQQPQSQEMDIAPTEEETDVTTNNNYPLAISSPNSCPDFSDVMISLKTTISDLSKVVTDAIGIFTNVSTSQCNFSLRCFLRTFSSAYKEVSSLVLEASSLKTNVEKLIIAYTKYSTKCISNWSFGNTLQLVELFNFIEGKMMSGV